MTNDWYSTSFPSHEDEVPSYCAFCLINFKKYNEVINNVCQVCGRVHQKTREDKQPLATISSINAPPTSETEHSQMKGISLEIDTSPLIMQDETTKGITSGSNIHASFGSFKEAQDYLNQTADLPTRILRQKKHQKMIIKAKGSVSLYNTHSLEVTSDQKDYIGNNDQYA